MRKLKYTLLFVMLIFGLNSCLSTMVGWGICEQYGGCYDLKRSDPGGVDNYFYKNPLEANQYINSLTNMEKKKIKIDENVFINVPKDIILKKATENGWKYFYDEKRKIGFEVYIINKNEYSMVETRYNKIDTSFKLIKESKNLRIFKNIAGRSVYIKKISQDYYMYFDDTTQETMDELRSFYIYLIELN